MNIIKPSRSNRKHSRYSLAAVQTATFRIFWAAKEQLIFPEIEYDKIDKVRGMDVIFVTTAKTDEEARELLTQFNMPFAKA